MILRWELDTCALWIRHPGNESVVAAPLTSWPQDSSGEPLREWRIPVTGARQRDRVREWENISRGDRDLVLALLDALPAVADKLAAPEASRRQAAKLLQVGLTESGGGRLKRALRDRLICTPTVRA